MKMKFFTLGLAAIFMLIFAFYGICFYMLDYAKYYTEKYPKEKDLSEAEALRISLNALISCNYSPCDLEPESFSPYDHESTMYWASNIYNPNQGYVLWHLKNSEKAWDFQVSLEKKMNNDVVSCRIYMAKWNFCVAVHSSR